MLAAMEVRSSGFIALPLTQLSSGQIGIYIPSWQLANHLMVLRDAVNVYFCYERTV